MNSILIGTLGATAVCLIIGLYGSNIISGSKGFLKNLFKKTKDDTTDNIENEVEKTDKIVNDIRETEKKSEDIKTIINSDINDANEKIKETEDKNDVGKLSNQLDKEW